LHTTMILCGVVFWGKNGSYYDNLRLDMNF